MERSFVQKLLEIKKTEGNLEPQKQGGAMKNQLDFHPIQLAQMVEKYPDATFLPSHKVTAIEPLIQSVGASVLYMSPYSPDLNPIQLWWSQRLRFFASVFSNHIKNG